MTDEELVYALRNDVGVSDYSRVVANLAADRIEQLVKERDESEQREATAADVAVGYLTRAETAEAKLAKAVNALRLVTDACDEGQMFSMGAGGMTIDAQIRRSVYNKVPAWPIEEARAVLAGETGE